MVPIIEFGHRYQPPSVIAPRATQVGFKVTSALLPTVTVYSGNLSVTSSSLLINKVDLIGVASAKVTFQYYGVQDVFGRLVCTNLVLTQL
jgi:hypothetical protein